MVYILFFVVSFCTYFFFFFILTAYLLFRLDKFQMLNSQPHVASGYIEQHRANIFANQTLWQRVKTHSSNIQLVEIETVN